MAEKTRLTVGVLLIVILALALAAVVYLGFRSRSQRIEKYHRAYEEIKVGDSRDVAVRAMGEPHEVRASRY